MVVRYVCIFYVKNVAAIHDDFWCLFLTLWTAFAVALTNSCNWILPGIYTPTYEICSCNSQDYSQPKKFENTAMILSFATFIISAIVTYRIKVFKHKINLTISPVVPNQNSNNILAELKITMGIVVLIITVFFVSYILSLTNSTIHLTQNTLNSLIQLYFLLMLPTVFNLFAISFYVKHELVKKSILREFKDAVTIFKVQ